VNGVIVIISPVGKTIISIKIQLLPAFFDAVFENENKNYRNPVGTKVGQAFPRQAPIVQPIVEG